MTRTFYPQFVNALLPPHEIGFWHFASAVKVLSLRELSTELRKFDDQAALSGPGAIDRSGH